MPPSWLLVAALGMLGAVSSVLLQHVAGMLPCTLCILSRLGMLQVGALGLLQGSVTPRASRALGHSVAITAVLGALVSGYHLTLLYRPGAQCAGELSMALGRLVELAPALAWLIEPQIACGLEQAFVLGVPLPGIGLALFSGVLLVQARAQTWPSCAAFARR